MTAPLRVLHLITELDVGGTEMMLARLLARMDRARFHPTVISLKDCGPVGAEIAALGIPVYAAGMTSSLTAVARVGRRGRLIRAARPDLLQCWLYHAGLLGLVAGRAAGVRTIVWSIQNATLDPALSRVGTRLVARASALLSGLTAALVSPSRVALQAHLAAGYRSAVVRMIPNGFDLDRFRPDPIARVAVRRELNLPPDTFLIDMMARFDPQKDHATFLGAAARLAGESRVRGVNPHFVLCGLHVDRANVILGRLVAEAGLEPAVHLLGLRRDMPRVTAALDIAALSSAGQEAFPPVAGEAMSCGVPCVVTDIGDASYLVGNTGLVVARAGSRGDGGRVGSADGGGH
ncbi:MAG: glycosyltransferase [Planctomycetes bacterium]|nr:glycosyltransferase [Planctomycetota bacterium]